MIRAAIVVNGIILGKVKYFKYRYLGCRVSGTEVNKDLEQNIKLMWY
jgi:hypothetical protein